MELTFIKEYTEQIAGEEENCIQVEGFPRKNVFMLNYMMFQDENYLWSRCIMNSVFQQVGCSPNFFVKSNFPTCTTMRELRDIQMIFRKIKTLTSTQFAKETGCLFQCSKIRYKVKEVKEEDITWKTDWISEVEKI